MTTPASPSNTLELIAALRDTSPSKEPEKCAGLMERAAKVLSLLSENAAPQAGAGSGTPANSGGPEHPAVAAPVLRSAVGERADADFARGFTVALARVLKVSPPTIKRWVNGESAPHPLGQESVLRALSLPSANVERAAIVGECVAAVVKVRDWHRNPDVIAVLDDCVRALTALKDGATDSRSTDK